MGKYSHLIDAEIASYDQTEWAGIFGGVEVTIFAKPITHNDLERVQRLYPEFPEKAKPGAMIEMLILKATDADGDKFFDKVDKPKLMRTHANRLGEIANTLFASQLAADTDEAFEDRVKN